MIVFLCLGTTSFVLAKGQSAMAQGVSQENRYAELAKEAERTQELLTIWKDHVRTLTQERNEAYETIEKLKQGQGSAKEIPASTPTGNEQYTLQRRLQAAEDQNRMLESRLKTISKKGNLPAKVDSKEKDARLAAVQALTAENQALKAQIAGKVKEQSTESTENQTLKVKMEAFKIQIAGQEKDKAAQTAENQTLKEALDLQSQKLKAGQDELAAVKNSYETKLAQAGIELKEASMWKGKAGDLEKAVDDNEHTITDLNNQLKTLRTDKQSTEEILATAKTQLQSQNQAQQALSEETATQIKQLREENSALKMRFEQVASDVEEDQKAEKQERETLKSALDLQSEKLKASQDNLAEVTRNYESKLQGLNGQMSDLDKTNSGLNAELKEASMWKGKAGDLEKAVDDNERTITDLNNQLRKLKIDKQAVEETLTASRTQVQSQNQKYQALSEETDGQVKQLKEENFNLKENFKQAASEVDEKQKAQKEEREALKEALDLQSQKLKAGQDELAAAKTQLQSQNQAQQALSEEAQKLKTANDTMRVQNQIQVKTYEAKLQDLNNQSLTQNQRIKDNEHTITDLSNDLRKIKADKQTAEESLAAANAQLESQSQKYQGLSTEIQKLKVSNENIRSQSLQAEEKTLAQIQSLKEENSRLLPTREQQAAAIGGLEKKLTDNLSDLSNLKSNFESYLESLEQSFQDRKKE